MTTNAKIFLIIYIATLTGMLYYNLAHPPVNDGVKEYETFLLNLGQGWEYRRTLVNSSLITTWLPAMVARYTGLDAMFLFRLTPPIFYALMPAFTYLIARRYLAVRYALIAALVVIANSHILFFPDIGRVGVGIAFFAGMIWALLHNRLWWAIGFALLVVFAHYGTALIAIGTAFTVWAGCILWRRKLITQYMVVFLVLVVSIGVWHFWISSYSGWVMATYGVQVEMPAMTGDMIGPKIQAIPPGAEAAPSGATPRDVTATVITSPAWSSDTFLNIHTREYAVLRALGVVGMTIPETIEVVANWIAVGAITIGLWLLWKAKRVDDMFKIIGASLWLLIVFTVAVPWLSQFYGGMRMYFTTLPILAVGLPAGVKWIAGKVRIKPIVLCGAVLALLAISTSGLVYRPFGEVKTFPVYWNLDSLNSLEEQP